MNNFYLDNIYKPNYEKIRAQVKVSNLLFTDGTHRIVGIKFIDGHEYQVEITYIGMRCEIAFAKQVALENGIRIITDVEYSLILFRDYKVGTRVFFYYENTSKGKKILSPDEKLIRKSDIIITDKKFCSVGLRFDERKMKAPKIIFMSDKVNTVHKITEKYNVPEKFDRLLARELLLDHRPGQEIDEMYYSCIAKIYSHLKKFCDL